MKLSELAMRRHALHEAVEAHGIGLWAYAATVAEAYDAAPLEDPRAPTAYAELAKSNDLLFKRLSRKTDVQFTDDDPYGSAEEVAADVVKNQRLKIFTGGSEHPILTPRAERDLQDRARLLRAHGTEPEERGEAGGFQIIRLPSPGRDQRVSRTCENRPEDCCSCYVLRGGRASLLL